MPCSSIPMYLVDAKSAAAYLVEAGRIASPEMVEVREMAGGVSNIVLHVRSKTGQPDFVLKQARGQLRVVDPWFCSVERIHREVATLRACERILATHSQASTVRKYTMPRVLFEDPENFLFAMDAAPAHQVWKNQLLAGDCEPDVAVAAGELLGALHSSSWLDEQTADEFDDRQFFDALRVDPYYRHIVRIHPALQPAIASLIDSLDSHRRALVHGDFSPKNLLVYDHGLMLIDCEVGHFGDPAFDLGFLLTHLFLKAVRAAPRHAPYLELIDQFWRAYSGQMANHVGLVEWQDLERRTVANFLGCSLARIDGKSKVEYLSDSLRSRVREYCIDRIGHAWNSWQQIRLDFSDRSTRLMEPLHGAC